VWVNRDWAVGRVDEGYFWRFCGSELSFDERENGREREREREGWSVREAADEKLKMRSYRLDMTG